jgi:hypothetical protein
MDSRKALASELFNISRNTIKEVVAAQSPNWRREGIAQPPSWQQP